MREFPTKFTPAKEERFRVYHVERCMCYLRREIYEHILSRKDVTDYFQLDKFASTYKLTEAEMVSISETVSQELVQLGWQTGFGFGHTGMFVYADASNPPTNLYPDGFE